MKNERIELYPAERETKLVRENRIWTSVALTLAALLLAGCIVLCLTSRTVNEDRHELIALILSGFGGCAVIWIWSRRVRACRSELRHLSVLHEGETEVLHGVVTLLPGRFQIPGSVSVQTLRVQSAGGETRRVSVISRCARHFRDCPEPLTLYTVHGFVVAYESKVEDGEHHETD